MPNPSRPRSSSWSRSRYEHRPRRERSTRIPGPVWIDRPGRAQPLAAPTDRLDRLAGHPGRAGQPGMVGRGIDDDRMPGLGARSHHRDGASRCSGGGVGLRPGGDPIRPRLVDHRGRPAADGDAWRIGVRHAEYTALETSGLFARCRNPIFTGMLLVAGAVAAWVPIAAPAWLVLWVGLELQVRVVEEPHLLAVHGDRYRLYAERTGRFLPGVGRGSSSSR